MFYTNNYWGMNLLWWFIWGIMLFWIFALPYDLPGQRRRKDSPLELLQKRFISGEITPEEYRDKKNILENDSRK